MEINRQLILGENNMVKKMSFNEMISALDGAVGRLIVPSIKDLAVNEAKELIINVSLSLGEWSQDLEDNN